ncbi:MAG TPA: dihydrolipoamide acetyltransferase family protein, partial [Chloroflexota bacterium]
PAAPSAAAPAAAAAKPPPLSGELKPFTRMQAVVARRMVESKTQVPHIYLTISIDMAAAMKFRADSNEFLGKESGLSVNDLFIKAVALTLRRHPDLNASYRENGIQYNAEINVGFAVSLPGGLVVPVIRNADQRSLPQIAAEARTLANKARTTGLALADYEGGTFSTSNLGMLGVEEFDAVVNPPQAGILAIGAITEEPVVRGGQIVVGQKCRVTLSCDHRVVYGWTAGEFLRDLKGLLERPLALVY